MESQIWIKDTYTVKMVDFDGDLKAFEIRQGDKIQTIYPATIEDMERIEDDLSQGECVDGWEDGNGGIITISDNASMQDIADILSGYFRVNGEDEKYATFYENKEVIIEQYDDSESFKEQFEDQFEVDIDKLSYPIITFDRIGVTGGKLFQKDEVEYVIQEAKKYFKLV